MVRVAFERVELDAVQLLEALPAALAREVVLHLGRVLLHVPVERCPLSALVATDLAPGGQPAGGTGGGGAGVRVGGAEEKHRGGVTSPRGWGPTTRAGPAQKGAVPPGGYSGNPRGNAGGVTRLGTALGGSGPGCPSSQPLAGSPSLTAEASRLCACAGVPPGGSSS